MGEAQRDITSWKGQPQFFSWTARRPSSSREVTRNSCCSLSLTSPTSGCLTCSPRTSRSRLPASTWPGWPYASYHCPGTTRFASETPWRLAARPPPPRFSLAAPGRGFVKLNGSPPPQNQKIPVLYFQIFPNVWGNRKNASESFGLLQLKRIESVGRGEGADREGRAPAHERGILYTRKPWEVLNAKE